jgi:hypothetical protein
MEHSGRIQVCQLSMCNRLAYWDCELCCKWLHPQAEWEQSVDLLRAASERVAAGTMPKARLTEISLACGLHDNPAGLLSSDRLRGHVNIMSTVTYDWMHAWLQDGVMNDEISALLVAAQPHGYNKRDLEHWLADKAWNFPAMHTNKSVALHRIFSERRESATDPQKVKATASELLGVYSMLQHWVGIHLANEVTNNVKVAVCMSLRPRRHQFGLAAKYLNAKLSNRRIFTLL